jgi:hypothetical protein
MKTLTPLFALIIFAQLAVAQNEYKASNGITYKIGDQVELAKGTGANGKFINFQWGGILRDTDPDKNMMPANWQGVKTTIKKIKSLKVHGTEKTYFVVPADGGSSGWLFIEDAIAACEIKDCARAN